MFLTEDGLKCFGETRLNDKVGDLRKMYLKIKTLYLPLASLKGGIWEL